MSKPDIRILGLDLDGTVFTDDKKITPRTLAAIKAATEKGVYVLPATGRPVSGVPQEFLQVPGVRYALTSNGATVTELATGKKLVNLCFAPQDALDIYHRLIKYDSVLDVFVDGMGYTARTNRDHVESYVPAEILPYIRKTRNFVEDMEAVLRAHPNDIEKFSIMYRDMDVRNAAWADATQNTDAVATASFPVNMELNAPGVDKGAGLLALAKHLGFGPEQVMACGDSGNDLEMIRKVGLGVAMANSTPAVLEAADAITAGNNEDGVAIAIEKYILGMG